MTRWKAASIHLAISLALASLVTGVLYLLWYPSPYFSAGGASTLIMVLMGVDVCLGPLLTLVVVSPTKQRTQLRFDLSVIALLQTAARIYGIHTIAMARPVYLVAEIDRLVLVPANQISDADLAKGTQPLYRRRSWQGPQLVGALPPQGQAGIDVALAAVNTGKDIDSMPQYYVPYSQVIDRVLKRGLPLDRVAQAAPAYRSELDKLKQHHPGSALIAVPLVRGEQDYAAILSTDHPAPLAILPLDLWPLLKR